MSCAGKDREPPICGNGAQDFLARKTVKADDREFTASGDAADLDGIRQFAVAYLRHEQDLDLQAFGVRFDNYYITDGPCLPSRTAMWTGRFGIHNGVINHGGAASEPFPDGVGMPSAFRAAVMACWLLPTSASAKMRRTIGAVSGSISSPGFGIGRLRPGTISGGSQR